MFLLPLQSITTTSRRPKKSLTTLNISLALQEDFKVTNYFEMMQKKKKEPYGHSSVKLNIIKVYL
jgi:hypothetical protein